MRMRSCCLFDVAVLYYGASSDWAWQLAVLTAEDFGGRSRCVRSVSASEMAALDLVNLLAVKNFSAE